MCGVLRPKNWCKHLRNAAIKAGVPVKNTPLYVRSLTQLRKNQRADKTKSGRKAPRKFDLLPIRHQMNIESDVDASSVILAPQDKTGGGVCYCGNTDSDSNVVACSNVNCKVKLYHMKCVRLRKMPKVEWTCLDCRNSLPTKRKLEFEEENTKKQKSDKVLKEKCSGCSSMFAQSYIKVHRKKYCSDK